MKKVFFFLVLFIIQTICFAEQLNKNWINKDSKSFEKVLSFIDKNDFSNSNILNLMNEHIEKEALGFNLLKSKSVIPSGYLSIYFSYISYKDLPCEFKISFYIDNFAKIEKELPAKQVQRIKKNFILNDNYYVFSMKNSENYKKYYEYKQKQIGTNLNLNIPSQYQEYYDFLISPFNDFSYGYIIGVAPEVPYGRIAMTKLMELKNKDVFINIIKSDNPAGRVYGMEGLLRLDNSSKNMDIINEVFEKLINDNIRYEAQDGCIVYYDSYEKIDSENISKYIQFFPYENNWNF